MGAVRGLRRSGGAGTGVSKAIWTTSGSSAARLALGMGRKQGQTCKLRRLFGTPGCLSTARPAGHNVGADQF